MKPLTGLARAAALQTHTTMNEPLTHTELRIILALCDHPHDYGNAWPGYRILEEETRRPKRALQAAFRRLRARGLAELTWLCDDYDGHVCGRGWFLDWGLYDRARASRAKRARVTGERSTRRLFPHLYETTDA